jgi:EpsD family peptidyl-prolyl cis-trans isomerase
VYPVCYNGHFVDPREIKDKRVKLIRISVLPLALLAALIALQGCGKEDRKKAASQVVAKVNDDELSVHQVNFILSKAQGVTAENAGQAKREILEKLIDQQLAIQQAEAAKLDRSPAVMQAIDAARRDIIARAYIEQIASAQPKPSVEDARKYYADHPELFSQRRVYNLQEILVPANLLAEMQQMVAQNKSMQDIAASLKARNIQFAANAGVRPADQLPMLAAARLHTVKDGQTTVIEGPQGAMVVHVVASQAQPITEEEALPRIQQFLGNQRSSEAVAAAMKELRGKAKIEHLGEFSATTPAEQPAAAAKPDTAKIDTAAGAIDAKSAAKGVAGLK